MTLSEFMNCSIAFPNKETDDWSVEIVLKNLKKSVLTVENCKNEFEAKERAYLYLNNLLKRDV